MRLLLAERWRAGRRMAMSCGLFVGVGEFNQLRFTPRSPEQLKSNGQSIRSEAAGNNDGRQAGIGTQLAVAAHLHLANHVCLAADRRTSASTPLSTIAFRIASRRMFRLTMCAKYSWVSRDSTACELRRFVSTAG